MPRAETPSAGNPVRHLRGTIRVLGLLALPVVLLGGCKGGDSTTQKGPQGVTYPVEAIRVEARDVQYSIFAVGSVDAFEQVEATSKVEGVVEKVLFTEGDTVKEGQVLVEVEPQRYRLAAQAARAEFDRAQVEYQTAESMYARRLELKETAPDIISEDDLDSLRREAESRKAAAMAARANAELAELKYRDSHVRAPHSGTIETRSVQTGQYVKFGQALSTLIRRDPLLLRFQVPEQDAGHLRPEMTATFSVRDNSYRFEAVLVHVATKADETTRMTAVIARVTDAKRDQLRPGAFAEITVPVAAPQPMPVIPQTAIRPTARGFLGFVVEDGNTARERLLTLGLRTPDGWVEVRSGVKPGEMVVIRGSEALRDGVTVSVEQPAPPAGTGTPAPAKENL